MRDDLTMISVTPMIASIDLANLAGWAGVPFFSLHSKYIHLRTVCLVEKDNLPQ